MANKTDTEKLIEEYVRKYFGVLDRYSDLISVVGLDVSNNLAEINRIRSGIIDLDTLVKIVTPAHIRSLFKLTANFTSKFTKIIGDFKGNAAIHAANVIYANSIEYNRRFRDTDRFARSGVKSSRGADGDKMLMVMELNRRMPNFIDICPKGSHERNREASLLYEDILKIIDEADCSFDDFKVALDRFINSKKFLKGNGKFGHDGYRYQYYPEEYEMNVDSFRGTVTIVEYNDDGDIISKKEYVSEPEVISDEGSDALLYADF